MKQKTASKLKPSLPVLVKKTWLHITEGNDHPCYRILIRALKTV